MGIPGLWSYLREKLPKCLLQEQHPQKVGIDAHGLLYFWRANPEEFRKFIRTLQQVGHQLYFIFDGEAPEEKRKELEKRKHFRQEARKQAEAIEQFLNSPQSKELSQQDYQFLKKQKINYDEMSWQITKENRDAILKIIKEEGAESILAPREADDVLLEMMKQKTITVILTQDMDFLEYPVTRLWIPNFKEAPYICYDLDIAVFCNEEDIMIENLQEVAYLCKNKYMTPSEAISNLRYYGSLQTIMSRRTLKQHEDF